MIEKNAITATKRDILRSKVMDRMVAGELGAAILAEELEEQHASRDAKVQSVSDAYSAASSRSAAILPKRDPAREKVAKARAALDAALKELGEVEGGFSDAHHAVSLAQYTIRELEAEAPPQINAAIEDLHAQIGHSDSLKIYDQTTDLDGRINVRCTNADAVAAHVKGLRAAVTQLELLRRQSARNVDEKIAAIMAAIPGV